ncbi:hypothetical protein CRE_07412 [Caenorhabditis remanei]|uniref:Uncharacterized protein n=1 Tax=Caenorhabditis remanei TaxID=31234 RepID=E3M216_CAERE|nr:hypothetical protein CRE_07412 [Caenorhabditis remanei]
MMDIETTVTPPTKPSVNPFNSVFRQMRQTFSGIPAWCQCEPTKQSWQPGPPGLPGPARRPEDTMWADLLNFLPPSPKPVASSPWTAEVLRDPGSSRNKMSSCGICEERRQRSLYPKLFGYPLVLEQILAEGATKEGSTMKTPPDHLKELTEKGCPIARKVFKDIGSPYLVKSAVERGSTIAKRRRSVYYYENTSQNHILFTEKFAMAKKSKISKIQIANQGYVDLILICPQFTMDIEEPKVDEDCKLDDVFMKESTCATGKNESGPGTHSICWSVFTRISDISQQPLPHTAKSCHGMRNADPVKTESCADSIEVSCPNARNKKILRDIGSPYSVKLTVERR